MDDQTDPDGEDAGSPDDESDIPRDQASPDDALVRSGRTPDATEDRNVAVQIDRLESADADADERKAALRRLRGVAEERPAAVGSVVDDLVPFLDDGEQSVRLTTAKLFVAVAESEPEPVVDAVPRLAARLADDDELHYVRARAAEAIGYVALERPDAAAAPEVLADLRVGLAFGEPEVKTKLAKAFECIALGNPRRLRHHAPKLAEGLDDGDELVRYHLCTALAVVGCEYPDALAEVGDDLAARLDDGSPHVRGRAAEALGLLARVDDGDGGGDADRVPRSESTLRELCGDEEPFVADRARVAVRALDERGREGADGSDVAGGDGADDGTGDGSSDDGTGDGDAADASDTTDGDTRGDDTTGDVGTLDGIAATTDDAVEAITTPDTEGECLHCGLALPGDAPPLCPRCGAPQ